MVSAPSAGEYYGALVAGPIFKDVAYKVYSTSLEIHKQINNSTQKFLAPTPFTKSGLQKVVKTIYDELSITCTSANANYQWLKSVVKDSTIEFVQDKTQTDLKSGFVPDLTGLNLKDALYLLENSGFNVKISGSGSVKNQSLEFGTKYKKGTSITLVLS